MLPIKLFRLVFCLFQFNQNIETHCFGIEGKHHFVSDSADTCFKGHPTLAALCRNPLFCVLLAHTRLLPAVLQSCPPVHKVC